jgi:hypothetical protein
MSKGIPSKICAFSKSISEPNQNSKVKIQNMQSL